MFIRVKSKITGHEFDIHESRVDEAKHARVDKRRYPPTKSARKPKFRVRNSRALSISPVLPVEEVETAYYLRLHAQDRPGVLARVASILSERGINIESIMQKDVEEQDGLVPIIILTHRVREQSMNDAIAAMEALDEVSSPLMRIRVEQLN